MKTDKMRAILTILSLVMLLTVVICTTSCNNTPVEPNDTTDGRESTEAPTEIRVHGSPYLSSLQ